MHKYLYRFLSSPDATFQHIAVWTIVQLLESGGKYTFLTLLKDWDQSLNTDITVTDPQLISNIRSSTLLIPNIRLLASSRASSPASSVGTPHSHRSQVPSYQETEPGEGQGEIQLLARRILEFVDADDDGVLSSSLSPSHMQPGSSVDTASGRDHEELRKSVREAFAMGSHH